MWSRVSRRVLRSGLAVLLIVPLGACGGGDSGGSTQQPTTPTSTGPTRASITVTCQAPQLSFSPLASFEWRATFNCSMTESAGLNANLNFIRVQFVDAAGFEVERQEIGANALLDQMGTNVLGGGSTFAANFHFDHNAGTSIGGILTFDFTDARGNRLSADFVFSWF